MPTSPTIPNGTQLGMSFEIGVDIDLTPSGAPTWQPIRRSSAMAPSTTPITNPAETYDDFGAPNAAKISESWAFPLTTNVNRNTSTGLYLPEVEMLKSYTEPDAVGDLAVAHIRWYDKPFSGLANPNDAYEGWAYVGMDRGNTGNADTGTWSFTLTGKGKRVKIVNPFTGWGVTAPTITGATPSGAAAGAQVVLTGTQFVGASAVKFAAVAAPIFTILGGSTIVVTVPAGVAGSAPITVTNPTGISAAFPYVRA